MDKDFTSENLKNLSPLQELHGKNRIVRVAKFWHNQKIADSEMIQKISHFTQNVRLGILPDGEVLEDIANALDKYLNSEMESLDLAFISAEQSISASKYRTNKNLISDYLRVLDYKAYQKVFRRRTVSYAKAIDALFEKDGAYIAKPRSYEKALAEALPDRKKLLDAMIDRYKSYHRNTHQASEK